MQAREVVSVDALIRALDGPTAAADVLGTTPQNVVNWRLAGRIPAKFHKLHSQALRARKIDAPDALWGFVEAAE